ncbi:MAG: hypothetical protein ABIV63_09745, partial [Caldimonas sp.]
MRSLLVAPIYAASRFTGGGQRTQNLAKALGRLGTVRVVLISEEVHADLESGLDSIRGDFPAGSALCIQRSTPQFSMAPEAGA